MPSPKEVCQELLRLLPTVQERRATLRPYNVHDPNASSIWWLVPSTEFPSFRFAKVFVSNLNTSDLEIGLAIEKGFGEKMREVYPAKKDAPRIMGASADWAWRELVAPEAEIRLGQLARKISRPMQLRVIGSYGPPSESIGSDAPTTTYIFDVSTMGSLSLSATTRGGPDMSVGKASNLAELVGELRLLETTEAIWVDFELFSTWPPADAANAIAREAWSSELVHFTDLLFSVT